MASNVVASNAPEFLYVDRRP